MRWLRVIGCAVLGLLAASAAAGCTGSASTGGQRPVTPASSASAAPAATSSGTLPAGSPPAAGSDCPATPVSGPQPTLTFPGSIGTYQLIDGPSSTQESPPLGPGTCTAPAQYSGYEDSQGNLVTIEAGQHANLWPTLSDFWGAYLARQNGTVTSVPAGPLGGQASCSTIPSLGTVCVWLDSDTFGSLIEGEPSVSVSEVASLMLEFRAGVEHTG